jgi:hypothetical protein
MRKDIAARIMSFGRIKIEEYASDVLKKPWSDEKFHSMMRRWLFHLPETNK